jgi:hypothetical protein
MSHIVPPSGFFARRLEVGEPAQIQEQGLEPLDRRRAIRPVKVEQVIGFDFPILVLRQAGAELFLHFDQKLSLEKMNLVSGGAYGNIGGFDQRVQPAGLGLDGRQSGGLLGRRLAFRPVRDFERAG